jgi:ferrochelatase
MLADTLRRMADDGVRRALAFATSAYASHPGCRQYLDDIARARVEVGERAPGVDKLRLFYNHPGFVEPLVEPWASDRPEPRRAAAAGLQRHSIRGRCRVCDYEASCGDGGLIGLSRAGRGASSTRAAAVRSQP